MLEATKISFSYESLFTRGFGFTQDGSKKSFQKIGYRIFFITTPGALVFFSGPTPDTPGPIFDIYIIGVQGGPGGGGAP